MRAISTALLILTIVCALGVMAAAQTSEAPVEVSTATLTVHISGDYVERDEANNTAEIRGDVRVYAYTDDPDTPHAAISAEAVSVDFKAGLVTATGDVLMRSDGAAFRASNITYDIVTDTLKLEHAAASVDAPNEDGTVFRGFFYGDKMERRGSEYIIINGTVTPCDDPDDIVLGASAKRLIYNSESGYVNVYGGGLNLLGHKIPLLPHIRFKHGMKDDIGGEDLPIPGYSYFDGVYIPFGWVFTNEEDDWYGHLNVTLGTRSHFRGRADYVRDLSRDTLGIYASHKEYVTDDITKQLVLSRVPELSYARRIGPLDPTHTFEVGTNFGRFIESEKKLYAPKVRENRTSAWLAYVHRPDNRLKLRGQWAETRVTQNFYTDGTRFRDLSVELGTGGQLLRNVDASVALVNHHTTGSSPFRFDDVDINHEAKGGLDWHISQRWALSADGRYDIERDALRDYRVEISRRSRYLTWGLRYDFSEKGVALNLAVNGLTGGTAPAETTPVVTDDQVQMSPEWVHEGSQFQF